jgi:hypothetical protein
MAVDSLFMLSIPRTDQEEDSRLDDLSEGANKWGVGNDVQQTRLRAIPGEIELPRAGGWFEQPQHK